MKPTLILPALFSVALIACGSAKTSQLRSETPSSARVIVASNVTANILPDSSVAFYYGEDAKAFEASVREQGIEICNIGSKKLSLPQYPSGMSDGLSVDDSFVYCAHLVELQVRTKSLERRWNTGLLRSFTVADTFDFLGTQSAVISYFTWVRCEDGGFAGGAHPTYRGGSEEAYQIAEKILNAVNTDKSKDEPVITLDDINIDCEIKL